jgi:hypothetical protein
MKAYRTVAARNRQALSYSIPWVTGGRSTLQLKNTGYFAKAYLEILVALVVGTGGTVTDADGAQSNFLPFVGLKNPEGEYIWSTNSRDLVDFAYRRAPGTTPFGDPSYVAWTPATPGTYNVDLRIPIDVSMNDGFNFDTGMLMRSLSNQFFYIEVQMAATTDLVGSGTCSITSITGSINVEEVFYDAFNQNAYPDVIAPQFNELVRLRSLQSNALLNGQNDLSYAVGPTLTDAFFRIMNNGNRDATITNLTYIDVRSATAQSIDFRTGKRLAFDQYEHLGKALRAGVYHEDFFDDTSMVNATRARDFLNTSDTTMLDFFVQYGGTPTGTSFVNQFFRELTAV